MQDVLSPRKSDLFPTTTILDSGHSFSTMGIQLRSAFFRVQGQLRSITTITTSQLQNESLSSFAYSYWPAVSHRERLTILSSTLRVEMWFSKTVGTYSSGKRLCTQVKSRLVLPTQESPTSTIFTVFTEFIIAIPINSTHYSAVLSPSSYQATQFQYCMAFVYQAQRKERPNSKIGPGSYSVSLQAEPKMAFAAFNCSQNRSRRSFLPASNEEPGPGQYTIKAGMAEEKYIVTKDSKVKKLIYIGNQKYPFNSKVERTVFKPTQPERPEETTKIELNSIKRKVCRVKPQNNSSVPTFPKRREGFNYNQFRSKLGGSKPQPKQYQASVGDYNIASIFSKPAASFGKSKKQNLILPAKVAGPEYYGEQQKAKQSRPSSFFLGRGKNQEHMYIKQQLLILKYIRDKRTYLNLPVLDKDQVYNHLAPQANPGPGQYYDAAKNSSFSIKRKQNKFQNFGSCIQRTAPPTQNHQLNFYPLVRKGNQSVHSLAYPPFGSSIQRFVEDQPQKQPNSFAQTQETVQKKHNPLVVLKPKLRALKLKKPKQKEEDIPGPGSYQAVSNSFSCKNDFLHSIFQSRSQRKIFEQKETDEKHEVGQYNTSAKGSSFQRPSAIFVSKVEKLRLDNSFQQDQKRPHAYLKLGMEEKRSDSFSMGVAARFKHDYFMDPGRDKKPGPGFYQQKSGLNLSSHNVKFKSKPE